MATDQGLATESMPLRAVRVRLWKEAESSQRVVPLEAGAYRGVFGYSDNWRSAAIPILRIAGIRGEFASAVVGSEQAGKRINSAHAKRSESDVLKGCTGGAYEETEMPCAVSAAQGIGWINPKDAEEYHRGNRVYRRTSR